MNKSFGMLLEALSKIGSREIFAYETKERAKGCTFQLKQNDEKESTWSLFLWRQEKFDKGMDSRGDPMGRGAVDPFSFPFHSIGLSPFLRSCIPTHLSHTTTNIRLRFQKRTTNHQLCLWVDCSRKFPLHWTFWDFRFLALLQVFRFKILVLLDQFLILKAEKDFLVEVLEELQLSYSIMRPYLLP